MPKAPNYLADYADADSITDLACEARMKYVNITASHHEGFCLWDSRTEPFNAMTHARCDLVRELVEQCDKKGPGFFACYTHVLNRRHPYAPTRDVLEMGRPDARWHVCRQGGIAVA